MSSGNLKRFVVTQTPMNDHQKALRVKKAQRVIIMKMIK